MSLSCRSVLLLACLPLLFTACASKKPVAQDENIKPPAVFKAHPGLLGQPVPPELQPIEAPAVEARSDADAVFASPDTPATRADAGQYSVYFDYRDTGIKPDYAAALKALGQQLAENRALFAQIEGNADDRGGPQYNQNLGLRRAEAVKKVLRAAGARSAQVKAVSYGDTRPRRQGQDEAAWAENRRVDVALKNRD